MSKYEPLARHLQRQVGDRVPMSFAEIERVLGRALPASRRYPAWWSNSPTNNPMTRVWLACGFVTEQVDIPGERLVFRRARPAAPTDGPAGRLDRYPGYGALRGTLSLAANFDPSTASDADRADP